MSLEPGCDAAATLWALLDETEQMRARRFRFEADRDAYVAAHAMLRVMLSREAGLAPRNWRLRTAPGGKPEIDPVHGCADLRFSLSHARTMVACAVGRGCELGIDVEHCDRAFPALDTAKRLFSLKEIERLSALSPAQQSTEFYRLWTLKEAYTKAIGQGIIVPLNEFSFCLDPVSIKFSSLSAQDPDLWQFAEIAPDPAHRLAVAVWCPVAGSIRLDATAMSLRSCAIYATGPR